MSHPTGATPQKKTATRQISAIWIIPLLAVLIGLGMIYRHYQNQGHHIQVVFDSAEGLEAAKTKVKYRSIDVGTVTNISFSKDLKKVIAHIDIMKDMGRLLREDTQFWVVKPRIGAGGVSGLNTILSGAYLEISPGQSTVKEDQFVGLEAPPIIREGDNGLHLTLTTKDGMRLSQGQPVIYRGFEVGEIDKASFDAVTRTAIYQVFIKKPYDSLITTNTYFWNVSGVSLDASAQGISFDVASLESLLSGGIQFDVPKDLDLGKPVTEPRTFDLYKNEESVYENRQYEAIQYLVLVSDSVAGLRAGSPVEYRGIRVGTVEIPYLDYSQAAELGREVSDDNRIKVMVRLEPERLYGKDVMSLAEFQPEFDRALRQGLTATIQSSNFILGSKIISLDFSKNHPQHIQKVDQYTVIPYQPGGIKQITDKVDSLLTKVERLPLQATTENINEVMQQANVTMQSADQVMLTVDATLQELQTTLKGLQEGSPVYQGANDSIIKLQQTLDDVQPILQNLNNDPNALIFGGDKPVDIQPPAKSSMPQSASPNRDESSITEKPSSNDSKE